METLNDIIKEKNIFIWFDNFLRYLNNKKHKHQISDFHKFFSFHSCISSAEESILF